MSQDFHNLTISALEKPIKDATSVSFAVPAELQQQYQWQAGQHITLKLSIDGAEVRRSYTISASPIAGQPLRITVKRVRDGLVSNYVNTQLKVGQTVAVMAPFGHFTLSPGERLRRTHYFFSAGSGITPTFAMLHTVLLAEPHSRALLLYGNASEKSIIFGPELKQLSEQFAGRLTVCHVLSDQSWLSGFKAWGHGRVDAKAIHTFIKEHPPIAQDCQYYICGPGGMNTAVQQALINIDVPRNRIHSETFGGKLATDDSVSGMAAKLNLRLNNTEHTVPVAAGQTLLEAALKAGLDAPYSCQSGICGACTATVRNGKTHMRACMALEESEIKAGQVLTCQAVACSEQLTLEYP